MKFIVIEGLDGAGKSTQIKLLGEYLKYHQLPFEYMHFPRTDSPFFGELISRFLRGELGDLNSVDPYLVALIYAGDRHNAAQTISNWLNEGKYVILDRYVVSNVAYQCAKIQGDENKEKLKQWIYDLEYNYFKIPQPDVNIFLDVPFKFTQDKLTAQRDGDDRDYLQGKADIHEADLDFQTRVRNMYLHLVNTDEKVKTVICGENDKMYSPLRIFDTLRETLADLDLVPRF